LTAVTILSWLSVVAVLSAYAWHHGRLFDRANVILCGPIALPAIITRAYSSAAISLAFGAIGAYRLAHPALDPDEA
jgi:hypothetical protein